MTQLNLYPVTLSFTPPPGIVGAGRMTLSLVVNAATGALSGQAVGSILEGTENAPTFHATVTGTMHSTGFGSIVRVGMVLGEAAVSVAPSAIGTSPVPFSASFGVDANWNGQGQFAVGSNTYHSNVAKLA